MNNTAPHRLQVSGMSCQHCVKAITQAVHASDAAARVTVDLPAGLVEVSGTALSLETLRRAIEAEGYAVTA
ncbi:MAG: copper chaperone [Rubrivivax sp.]|nr:MAG: copper chaperone [Rubrivivax sp.]